MSEILPTLTLLLTQLQSDIEGAWTDVKKIYDEQPREEVLRTSWPYAVIEIEEIAEGWGEGATARQTEQEYEVKISYKGEMPTERITLWKAAKFDALTQLLMPDSGTYATYGYLPYVPTRRFNEADNLLEDAVEISLQFSVRFAVDYH
jgi:hypothetical protein